MCGYFEHTGAKCNAYSEVRLSSVLGWGAGGGPGGEESWKIPKQVPQALSCEGVYSIFFFLSPFSPFFLRSTRFEVVSMYSLTTEKGVVFVSADTQWVHASGSSLS